MNDNYKSQISELQRKIFEMQNSEENDINNESINKDIKDRNSVFSINHSTDLNIFSSRNLPVFLEKKFTNLVSKPTITLFIESKYKPRMTPRSTPRGTPRSNRGTPSLAKKTEKKISGEIKDVEEDDSEEYYDDETDEEFNEKMKKLNEKNTNDSEQMKLYKKENRKMLYRLEDALAENEELQKKLIKIEEIVVKKQNELYSQLKKGFEILINDFNFTNKNRDILNSFLKLMNFSDEEINNLIAKKQKGLLGFFK